MFTLASICLSISEYFLSRQLLNGESYLILSFEAVCSDFGEMNHRQFEKLIVFRRNSLIGKIARVLKIEFGSIDRLIPTFTEKGVFFVFNIETNDFDTMDQLLNDTVNDGSLVQAVKQGCRLKNLVLLKHIKTEHHDNINININTTPQNETFDSRDRKNTFTATATSRSPSVVSNANNNIDYNSKMDNTIATDLDFNEGFKPRPSTRVTARVDSISCTPETSVIGAQTQPQMGMDMDIQINE